MTKLTFFTATGESFFLELPADMSIADIKTLLEGDVSPPISTPATASQRGPLRLGRDMLLTLDPLGY